MSWFSRMVFGLGLAAALPAVANAVEVEDVVWLSSKGTGLTVTAVRRPDRETVELTARAMEANAAEYCEIYEQLESLSPKWKKCVRENVSPARKIVANCRTITIMLEDGSYRPSGPGEPWGSLANPSWIIHADELFAAACRRRR